MVVCRNPSCYQWPLRVHDRYCSWCGECLVDLHLGFEELREGNWHPLVPPVLTSDRRPPLRLTIRHVGQMGRVTLSPNALKSLTPWLTFEPPGESRPLEPGQEQSYPVKTCMPLEDYQGRLLARASLRTDVGELRADFEVVPLPRFSVVSLQELHLSEHEMALGDLRLKILVGRTAVLREPRWLEEWGQVQGSGVEYPLEMDPQHHKELGLRLKVDPSLARALRGNFQNTLQGTLLLECVGREQVPLELPVELTIHLSPQMAVEPFRDRRSYRFTRLLGINDQEPLTLTISNSPGSQELLVQRLEVEAEPAWLKPPSVAPRRVLEGRSAKVTLPLDLSLLTGSVAQARLRILSNMPQVEEFTVEVQRVKPEAYAGTLVVDLGTSNTCAVLVDELGHTREVLLLDDPPAHTLPSILYYDRLERKREYAPGPEEDAGDPGRAHSMVCAAKRHLGDPDFRFEVYPFREPDRLHELSALEATTDLYRWVVKRTHEQLLREPNNRRVLLERVLITHPSRFSVSQLDALKSAIEQALLAQNLPSPPNVKLLQEPVGGALAFLHDPVFAAQAHLERGEETVTYPLLVYDFGGGTVDITLLEVTSRRRPLRADSLVPDLGDLRRIDPVLVHQALRDLVLARCARLALERLDQWGQIRVPRDSREHEILEEFLGSVLAESRRTNSWEDLRRNPNVTSRLSLRYYQGDEELAELGFGREQALPTCDELEARLRETLGGFRYSVKARVLGATGHRRCGGEDLTRILGDLLAQRFQAALQQPGVKLELPLDTRTVPAYQVLSARTNAMHLRRTAEQLKIALSEGTPPRDYEKLEFYADGLLRLVGPSELRAHVPAPTLVELEEAVSTLIGETITHAQRLLAAHHLASPAVVLTIGQGSRFPLVGRLLRQAFPDARHHRPDDAKSCVVSGAALHAGKTASDTSINVYLDRSSSTTTSRLGILSRRGSTPVFAEVVAAGLSIPEEGLSIPVRLTLQPGTNQVKIMENLGLEDRVNLDDGSRNPDIRPIRSYEFEIDEEIDPFDLDEAELTVRVDRNLDLHLQLKLLDREPVRFESVSGSDFGRSY